MINRKHTKHYKRKIPSNKLEYITDNGVYFLTHDIKVTFCMPEFYISKIFNHRFRVDKDKGKSGTGCGMIICRDLMVQLGLTDDFKRQVLRWDGATVHMK